jgi:hypothetical protein
MADDRLYLGTKLDGQGRVELEQDHLTTHAVCLGMTGSGKTGLGIVMLEELARRGVPLLIVDLKGDMVNLLLNFPALAPQDFEPWLPSDVVGDRDRGEVAVEQAELWRSGLQRSGLGPEDLEEVGSGVTWQLLTPGVASAAPLDILPTLSAPEGWDPAHDPDGLNQRAAGVTSALLSLVGKGGDPLSDPDHVLLSTIILDHWRRGDRVDLPRLLASIADPAFTTLGALPLESAYPRKDRMKLVMELNTLVASPAFAAWTTGTPLTMEELLGSADRPRATIVTVSHLDDRQRLFVLALLVSELVSWMRRQPAAANLRGLLYVDEVQGILPPHPFNPPTKGPLLTLLKQGRAFGVGVWLATQNPVDIDYKALGNAGVKVIGRLITDGDRERALEGLSVQRLDDGRDADGVVAGLGKREFLVVDVRGDTRAGTFASRWAMSYLRGPVALVEMGPLLERAAPASSLTDSRSVSRTQDVATPFQPVPPVVSTAVRQRYAAVAVGRVEPEVWVRSRVTVERKTLGLYRVKEEWWQIPVGSDGALDWEGAAADGSPPKSVEEVPQGLLFPVAVPQQLDAELGNLEREFVAWRVRQPIMVRVNSKLKLVAEPGETPEQFLGRCLAEADRADDDDQERARTKYETRVQTLQRRLARERDELARDQQQLESRKAEEVMGAVEGLFSVLLGSSSVRSAGGKAASRMKTATSKRRMRQRAAGEVEESRNEIRRIEQELEQLAAELQEEVDRIATESRETANRVEEVPIKASRSDVVVLDMMILWTGEKLNTG